MPVITLNELDSRHTLYLLEIRQAFALRGSIPQESAVHAAVTEYAAWFAERGIKLSYLTED